MCVSMFVYVAISIQRVVFVSIFFKIGIETLKLQLQVI
jgi:5-bromo-4-chloroindolyl phosphate hydrolysis protein